MATMEMEMERLGRMVAAAVVSGDTHGLEQAAQAAGAYRVLIAAAKAAGVDADDLEEMLARI